MTYIDTTGFPREPLVPGRAHHAINRFFGLLGQVGGAANVESSATPASPQITEFEENLRLLQETISEVSMHLPTGFARGLNRQFANLLDDEAWEDEDEFISLHSLTAFIMVLVSASPARRPGIGTNGKGSITASWTRGVNRLTVECLPSGRLNVMMSRQVDGDEPERAAFTSIRPSRLPEIVQPFGPEIWFDG